MHLKELIQSQVECVPTPNGDYINKEQVFECIELVEEKLKSCNNASPKLSTETIESFKEIITGLDGGLSQSEHLVLFEVLGFISR